jgi:transcriptional regulator GlxA family with amidase domain
VLAAAGLLDGRKATTHWQLADYFRSLFPRIALDRGCSSSTTAGS